MVGLIGGTGFERLIEAGRREKFNTPYGGVEGMRGEIRGTEVLFIPRHGFGHETPPHRINYRAMIYALRREGALKVISTSAAGAINSTFKPGDLVLVDQFIDFTRGRPYTFFDDVVFHVDMTQPYSPILREVLLRTAKKLDINVRNGGVYVCTEGPRFETPAEISAFRMLGGDVVGMTNVPEVVLARELGISYATIVLITNYAAGLQPKISQEEVYEEVRKSGEQIEKLLLESIKELDEAPRDPVCEELDQFVSEFIKKMEQKRGCPTAEEVEAQFEKHDKTSGASR